MDHNEAEEILNNSDLRERSYTENLAVINYQIPDIRTDTHSLVGVSWPSYRSRKSAPHSVSSSIFLARFFPWRGYQ